MVILSSGVNYGARRTLPYVTGATMGFLLLLLSIGLGFYKIIELYPSSMKYLAIGGSLYIIYMGYKIASSPSSIEVEKKETPKFYEGFLLQWLNPKAWIAGVSGATIFSSAENPAIFLTFAGIYFVVCYLSMAAWAVLGAQLANFLNTHFRLRVFDILMGLLLIITAAYLGYSHLR